VKLRSRCLIVLLASAVVAGCGNNDNDVARVQQPQHPQYADQSSYGQQTQQPQQYQQQAGQPVIINQAPAASSGVGDMIMGGALGYMLGSSGNNSRERVVERERVVQAPQPVAQSAPRQQYQQPQAAPSQPPAYNGWSKPAATPPAATQQTQYNGWSKQAVSKPSTPSRPVYGGFSKRR